MDNKKAQRLVKGKETYLIFFILIVISFLFSVINPNFLSKYNLVSIAQALTPYAILSLGVVFVIATGGTDLSVGATCIGSAVIAGTLYMHGMPLVLTLPVMILFGGLIGLINGVIIARLRIPPFITTLGTMMLVRGATALAANVPNVFFPTGTWFNKLFSTYQNMPVGFLWIIVIGAIVALILNKHRIGRYILAIGSNEEAARLSGINVGHYKTVAYVIAGMFAGIAGIFWASSFATVSVATGNGMELDAIAGAYIGGTSATGGSANVLGCILGSLMLVVIRSGLNFTLAKFHLDLNSSYMTFVLTGIIVVVAVLLDKFKETRQQKTPKERTPAIIRRKRLLVALSILLCVAMTVLNVVNYHAGEKEEKTVALLLKNEDNGYWKSVIRGATAAADEQGFRLEYRGPESEDPSYLPKQRELLQTLLGSDPVALGVACIADGFTDLIEIAYDKDIPVVQFDNGLWSKDREQLASSPKNPLKSFVCTNVYDSAKMCGEQFYETIRTAAGQADHYTVGIIQFEDNPAASNRSDGFRDGLTACFENDPNIKGKYQFETEVKPSAANNAYKEALEALYEKGVDAIFMTNEVVVNQCYDAIASSGNKYDDIIFCGFDGGSKQLEWMRATDKKPHLVGSVSQDPYSLGYMTVKTIGTLAEGKEAPEEVTVSGVWYTAETIDELLKKGVLYEG